MLTDQASNP